MVGVTALLFFVGDQAAVYRQPPQGNTAPEGPRLIVARMRSEPVKSYTRRTAPLHSTHVSFCPYVGVSKRHLEKLSAWLSLVELQDSTGALGSGYTKAHKPAAIHGK